MLIYNPITPQETNAYFSSRPIEHELTDESGRHFGTFGHRRLAILDLTSAEHQPLYSADGRHCITYNGEIYNFPELRAHFEECGAVFQSHCDTEAIVLGWAQ